jgi:hypothetical protein
MTDNDFNEIMMLLDRLQCELYFEAESVRPTEGLQKYFGNWFLTRVRLHVTVTYSSHLSPSKFHVNDSGFRLILAEGYLLYAVNTANELMYVYDTEEWVEWIRRIDTKIEEMFLYSGKRTPCPVLADHDDRTHLTLEGFLRKGPRPWFG